mmetsp:Transcript_590/g.782  ORF Transcript_590/g.782 Transcript_590/m.782 type:complete len:261 (+) Transcript_590:203-985(+)
MQTSGPKKALCADGLHCGTGAQTSSFSLPLLLSFSVSVFLSPFAFLSPRAFFLLPLPLHEASLVQALANHNVLDSVEHHRDVVCICSTGHVKIDLLIRVPVLALEFVVKEHDAIIVRIWPVIFRETTTERHILDLLCKQIAFVEEEDNGCLSKPPGITDLVEKIERLVHAVGAFVFKKHLVIFRDSSHKQHSCDVFKAMDPLLAFVPLAANIKHLELVAVDLERVLHNPCCADAGAEHVLLRRDIAGRRDLTDLFEEVSG